LTRSHSSPSFRSCVCVRFTHRKTIMFRHSAKALLILNAFFFLMSSASAGESRQLSMTPVPGIQSCVSFPVGTNALNPELCVLQRLFAHHVYVLKLDGQPVLSGIDDETTTGITSVYKNQAVQLRCAPQEIFTKETLEATVKEVQRQMPTATTEEAAKIADLLWPGPTGIELGRLCSATSNGETVLTAQIVLN
jgi:hypothetical protein